MDHAAIKERNFRTVNILRQRNQREQRRLDEKLNSKQGLRANALFEVNAVAKEQHRIKQELSRIRKTVTTTWGILPPRGGGGPGQQEQGVGQDHYRIAQLESMFKTNKLGTDAPDQSVPKKSATAGVLDSELSHADSADIPIPVVVSPAGSGSASPGSTKGETSEGLASDDPDPSKGVSSKAKSSSADTSMALSGVKVNNAKENVSKRLTKGATTNNKGTKPVRAKGVGVSGGPSSRPQQPSTTSHLDPLSGSTQPRFLTPIHEESQGQSGRDESDEEPTSRGVNVSGGTKDSNKAATATTTTSGAKGQAKKKKKDTKAEQEIQKVEFDQNKYNADGSLRTMHKLPDFDSRLSEAKKARYIRHKGSGLVDKELSVNDIFDKGKTAH